MTEKDGTTDRLDKPEESRDSDSAFRSGFAAFTTDEVEATQPTAAAEAIARRLRSAPSRYRAVRTHARGGLGEVFLAEDEELRRTVALKEIQDAFADDEASRNRFIFEAEITGKLEHPGIVPVYGLGVHPDGRPYYAMRFIEGMSLRDACLEFHRRHGARAEAFASVEFRELLGRFIDVAQAVSYAHSRGVIHRDLKPGNVMLGPFGETLVVDWGLAKIIGSESDPPSASLTGGTESGTISRNSREGVQTEAGAIVGTPGFMSPEQARGDDEAVGPESDIYSLGAILYVLLAGRGPFSHLGDRFELLGANGRNQFDPPRTIHPAIPAPLEAICLHAMETEVGRRYRKATDLADDLNRWLADEPVSVFVERRMQRVRRWMRRHPGPSAGISAAIAVGLIGLAVLAAFAGVKNRQLEDSNAELRAALGREAEEREKAVANEASALRNQKRAESEYLRAKAAVDDYFTAVSTSPELREDVPGMQRLRRELLLKAKEYYATFLSEWKGDPALEMEAAKAMYNLGRIEVEFGRFGEAQTHFLDFLSACEKLHAGRPEDAERQFQLVVARNAAGTTHRNLQRLDEAARLYNTALPIAERLTQSQPTNLRYRNELAKIEYNLGMLADLAGRQAESESMHRKALQRRATIALEDSDNREYRRNLAVSQQTLGGNLRTRGKLDEAEKLVVEALSAWRLLLAAKPAEMDCKTYCADAHVQLGALRFQRGRFDSALESFEAARALFGSAAAENPLVFGPRAGLAQAHRWIALTHRSAGRLAPAQEHYLQSQQHYQRIAANAPDSVSCLSALGMLEHEIGDFLIIAGQPGKSREHYEQALSLRKRLSELSPQNVAARNDVVVSHNALAEWHLQHGEIAKALEHSAAGAAIAEAILAALPANVYFRESFAFNRFTAGRALRKSGDNAAALSAAKQCVEIYNQLAAENTGEPGVKFRLGRALTMLGAAYGAVGDRAEAVDCLAKAALTLEQAAAASPNDVESKVELANAYYEAGRVYRPSDPEKAAESWTRAIELLHRMPTSSANARIVARESFRERGRVLAQLERRDEARNDFLQAMELADPKTRQAIREEMARLQRID